MTLLICVQTSTKHSVLTSTTTTTTTTNTATTVQQQHHYHHHSSTTTTTTTTTRVGAESNMRKSAQTMRDASSGHFSHVRLCPNLHCCRCCRAVVVVVVVVVVLLLHHCCRVRCSLSLSLSWLRSGPSA